MAFFNNQKHAGLALLLFAVLSILAGIVSLVLEAVDDQDVPNMIAAIGAIIAGFLYLAFAQRVRGKASAGKIADKLADKMKTSGAALDDKFDIVVAFVQVFAIATIIEGIFKIIADPAGGIISIIFGIICLWAYKKITDGKDSLVDKIVWILLLIVFLFTIISGLLTCLTIILIPLGIAMIIIGVFMFMALLDNDVKKKFGM